MDLEDGRAQSLRSPGSIAVPFLKWAGGKSIIADRIIRRIGTLPLGATYFEPFLGGGAVFFRLRPTKAVLADSNRALIRTYRVVKERVEQLIEELEGMTAPSRDTFDQRREEFNELLPAADGPLGTDDERRAALFVWLNHTCYNGLYRVNKEGKFNVPYGQYERAFIFDPENLRLCSQTLRNSEAQLESSDYHFILKLAKAGDCVYFDPPYHPLDETSNFTGYTSEGFGTLEQEQLAATTFRLIERGCRVVISNSPTPEIQQLYRGLRKDEVLVPRAINCVGSRRARIPELLIYPRTRMTLHDQWEKVVADCGFDLDGRSTYEVTAARVKKITGEEPRLIAKMDTREDLPGLLARKEYFVLPVSGSKYAIVPGDGYEDLKNLDSPVASFEPERQVPVTVALQAGESAAIQTALYTGLLEEVIGVPRLRPTLHNDRVTLKGVTIRYGSNWELPINGARVEVDAGFENHNEFFIFECKNWRQSELGSFNIRQLFFPQLRAYKELKDAGFDWKIRCFFLNVEPDTSIYRFWEYRFKDPFDYASIVGASHKAFRLVQDQRWAPGKLLEQLIRLPESKTNYVPQANDASKVLTLVQGVAEGFATVKEVANRFRFDPRQSNYYGEAAQELGLIERPRGERFTLTGLGAELARLPSDQATQKLIEQIFTLPVFREVARAAVTSRSTVLYPDDLTPLVRKAGHGRYNETTVKRRMQSVASWLNWIGESTGTIRVKNHPKPVLAKRTLDSY